MSSKPKNDRYIVDYEHLEKVLKQAGITPEARTKVHASLRKQELINAHKIAVNKVLGELR